jgi:hypothetical protein
LSKRGIRIFDFTQFAKPSTDAIKENAEALAAQHGLQIDYIRKKNFRKEERIQEILRPRGTAPGLVWIFSALEPCTTYQPWFNKQTKRASLRPDDGKCLPYYFYFIDPELGLCYVRVPTWCPFRLRSTVMDITGWRDSSSGIASAIACWTTPLSASTIFRRRSN